MYCQHPESPFSRRNPYTPGGKFYVSLAHTDADVDRTLEATEAAFRIVRE